MSEAKLSHIRAASTLPDTRAIESAVRGLKEQSERVYALIAGAKAIAKAQNEADIDLCLVQLLDMAEDEVGDLSELQRITAALPAQEPR